jgi:hypothetical protein
MRATHRTKKSNEPVAFVTVKFMVRRDDLAYAAYTVISLYDKKPTKGNIVAQLKSNLAFNASKMDCDEEWFKEDQQKFYDIADILFPSFV